MSKQKFYVVWKGNNPGVYQSWEKCQNEIKNVNGALFKSFDSLVEAIKAYLNKNDMMILISSSGTSKNIVNAAKYCKKNSIQLITLSGFKKNNPLSKYGNVNFNINSDQYNFIEMSHHIILVDLVDIFAKNKLSS